MPLLDIANVQLSLQNSLAPVRLQSVIHSQVLSGSWKISEFHRRLRFPFENLENQGGRLKIRVVATLEPKPSVLGEIETDDSDSESSFPTHVELREAWLDLDPAERMRRMKISKANKGVTPWNKGKKISEETRNRISKGTRLAMQDPKVRMKINPGRAPSEETKLKIGVGVRTGWKRRREWLMSQEACHFEWQNLVAEASRKGQLGEDELQWDSFEVLVEQSKRDWVESIKQRKNMRRLSGAKRTPKSTEQRKKIAEAIAAKWADPAYRERVISARAKRWSRKEAEDKPVESTVHSPEARVPQE